MTTPTQQLHDEHVHLLIFLADHLIPQAEAEDRVPYPAIARVMGAAEATATMSREHAEVGRPAREPASEREVKPGAMAQTASKSSTTSTTSSMSRTAASSSGARALSSLPVMFTTPFSTKTSTARGSSRC